MIIIRLFYISMRVLPHFILFFFNDTATTEIYTLSLHDALPISRRRRARSGSGRQRRARGGPARSAADRGPRSCSPPRRDRKSTRLNSSHSQISYAVFCLKKKKRWSAAHVRDH